jgi:hypothetical protein
VREVPGRVHVGGFFDPQVKKSMRLVQLQTDEDLRSIMLRAFNELFRAHGVPTVEQHPGRQVRQGRSLTKETTTAA